MNMTIHGSSPVWTCGDTIDCLAKDLLGLLVRRVVPHDHLAVMFSLPFSRMPSRCLDVALDLL